MTHKPRPMMILTGERQLGQRLSPNPRPLAWGHDSEGSGAVVLISANAALAFHPRLQHLDAKDRRVTRLEALIFRLTECGK